MVTIQALLKTTSWQCRVDEANIAHCPNWVDWGIQRRMRSGLQLPSTSILGIVNASQWNMKISCCINSCILKFKWEHHVDDWTTQICAHTGASASRQVILVDLRDFFDWTHNALKLHGLSYCQNKYAAPFQEKTQDVPLSAACTATWEDFPPNIIIKGDINVNENASSPILSFLPISDKSPHHWVVHKCQFGRTNLQTRVHCSFLLKKIIVDCRWIDMRSSSLWRCKVVNKRLKCV